MFGLFAVFGIILFFGWIKLTFEARSKKEKKPQYSWGYCVKKARRTHKYAKKLGNQMRGIEEGEEYIEELPDHISEGEEYEIQKLANQIYERLNKK